VATAIVLATTKSPSAAPAEPHANAPTPDARVARTDATVADAAVVAVVDAGSPPPRIDAAPITPVHAAKNPELDEQLRLAEAAKQSGDFLNQVKYADLALKADPRNVRARFLLGDGLIASQDFDHGCKYLRALTRYPPAQARAKDAGCPGN
jgi:tetratricopeptide (TPR) repeat protein